MSRSVLLCSPEKDPTKTGEVLRVRLNLMRMVLLLYTVWGFRVIAITEVRPSRGGWVRGHAAFEAVKCRKYGNRVGGPKQL